MDQRRRPAAQRRASAASVEAAGSSVEEILRAKSHLLVERMKELKCLLAVSRLVEDERTSLDDVMRQVALVLPSALQFPESAAARVSLQRREFRTPNFRRTGPALAADIVVAGRRAGAIELRYVGPVPTGSRRAFLPEERNVIRAVAERVADIVELKRAHRKLSSYEQRLRSLATRLARTQEQERRQLAIWLHDRIGQTLAVAKLKAESLRANGDAPPGPALDEVVELLREAIGETRSLTFEISPPILYELGLGPALEWVAEHVEARFGLKVEVRLLDVPALGEAIRVTLFRAVHELLTNAARHARASRAIVSARRDGAWLEVEVEDDGVGFQAPSAGAGPARGGGFGLFSIRERLADIGARFEIDSRSGRGTRAAIRVRVAGAASRSR